MTPDPNHPITDLNARFAATIPENTAQLIEALRRAGVHFDFTINGLKDFPEDQAYDVFWFRKEDDMDFVGQIIQDTIP